MYHRRKQRDDPRARHTIRPNRQFPVDSTNNFYGFDPVENTNELATFKNPKGPVVAVNEAQLSFEELLEGFELSIHSLKNKGMVFMKLPYEVVKHFEHSHYELIIGMRKKYAVALDFRSKLKLRIRGDPEIVKIIAKDVAKVMTLFPVGRAGRK